MFIIRREESIRTCFYLDRTRISSLLIYPQFNITVYIVLLIVKSCQGKSLYYNSQYFFNRLFDL